MMSDYLFILAASNVGYIIFNFLNLNAGWIHRMDRPNWERPYRAPTILIAIGGVLAFVNAALMGAGADVWGAHTLWTGLIFAALIIPVFAVPPLYSGQGRVSEGHGGRHASRHGGGRQERAGMLPYVALAAGVLIVLVTHYWATS